MTKVDSLLGNYQNFRSGLCSYMDNCLICKNRKHKRNYESNRDFNRRKYCSKECMVIGVSNSVKNLWEDDDYKKRMSEAHLGQIGWNKGKKMSFKHREKLSKVKIGKYRGEESPHWKGGLPNCKECSSKHKRNSAVCKNCFNTMPEKYNPNWKGGVNKEYYRKKCLERLARKKGAEGSHTLEEWLSVKIKYGFMCLCCKKTEPEITLSEDHIIPLSKGGSDYIENIQPLCKPCNSRKYTKIIDFRELVVI